MFGLNIITRKGKSVVRRKLLVAAVLIGFVAQAGNAMAQHLTGRTDAAVVAYRRALALTNNAVGTRFLEQRLQVLLKSGFTSRSLKSRAATGTDRRVRP